MVISIFYIAIVILVIAFVSIKKRLHLFEILFLWMALMYIEQNFATIVNLNLKMVQIPERLDIYWFTATSRLLWNPLLIIWYVELCFTMHRTLLFRGMLALLLILLLVSRELAAEHFALFQYTGWKPWLSGVAYASNILIAVLLYKWFHRMIGKERIR
ncbi:MAG TPA: hypothetical protein VE710_10895 [Candidatus Bathyarchaeia archaeon]|nr:hypothetical protein [Candidatus Bathyarchaeia archaeon]